MEEVEAQTIEFAKSQKTFKLKSNKGNKFLFIFKNIKSTSLLINSIFDDGVVKTFFETEFTLDKIKENKAFLSYDIIDEILEELFPLINEGKIHLFEEEGNKIKIIFDLPFKKYKEMIFIISEKKKSSDEKIEELYQVIITQNKEINDLKRKLENITNIVEILEEKIEKIEKDNIKVLAKKQFDENITINTKSDIFNSLDEIDFIIKRLKNDIKLQNKKIFMKLLFKATKDGSTSFHKKCDRKVQQLFFIKTTKGEIFGGYTEKGFRSRNNSIEDINAFLFSFLTRKIYNAINGKNVICDNSSYGPCFNGNNDFSIFISYNMLEDQSHTNKKSDSYFSGMKIDYELNNGEQYFYVQEMEVYQILYN